MTALRVLSVAVASGRVGYVLLDGAQLVDWAVSTTVTGKSTDLVAFVQELINRLKPDVVVTEKCDSQSKKGKRAKKLITAIARLASQNYVLDVSLARPRTFRSKYEEAGYLVSVHPELTGYLPTRKRRFFDFEPREMIIFEALALARAVAFGPPDRLAGAMG